MLSDYRQGHIKVENSSNPYSVAAFFLCLGPLLVGFKVIGAVHEDAIFTIHVMSVEVFSCIADMCHAEELSYLGSSHVNNEPGNVMNQIIAKSVQERPPSIQMFTTRRCPCLASSAQSSK